MARVDYSGRAEAYQRARTLPPAVLDQWSIAVAALRLPPPTRVLDLGAGPGGFLDALAEWTDATVIAVEPSPSMRSQAVEAGIAARHAYIGGVAEQIPLCDASIDWAWLSTVVHQFDDLSAAARELDRVVRPNGRVLVRGFLADVAVTGLFARFPGIERSARTFPSTDDVVGAFNAAGFAHHDVVDVVEPWSFTLDAWVTGVRSIRDTDSALRPLTDDEIDEGIRAVIATHARDEPLASPGTLRLLAFRR